MASQTADSVVLLAAFRQEGCSVCRVVLASMERILESWQYEGFTDVG